MSARRKVCCKRCQAIFTTASSTRRRCYMCRPPKKQAYAYHGYKSPASPVRMNSGFNGGLVDALSTVEII